MKYLEVGVGGMTCQGCAKSVTDVLQALPGVSEVKVSLEEAKVQIAYDSQVVKPRQFKAAIENAGFDVVCDGNCAAACS